MLPAHLGSPGERAVKRVCVCVPVGVLKDDDDDDDDRLVQRV